MSSYWKVLQIVVDSSVLDLFTIDRIIRPLSSEFQEIGTNAMAEHETYRRSLKDFNSQFKFHYCTLCEKPHVSDGVWEGSLCDCCLEHVPPYFLTVDDDDNDDDDDDDEATGRAAVTRESRETYRRTSLLAVGDPRLSPEFIGLSTKGKLLRTIDFLSSFPIQATEIISSSNWLYRMSVIPLLGITRGTALMVEFPSYNATAVSILSTCIYADLMRKELTSPGVNSTILLDVALYVLSADSQTEQERRRQFLDDDEACNAKFFGHDEASSEIGNRLLSAVSHSFLEILGLYTEDSPEVLDMIKNIGNSVGIFLTKVEHSRGCTCLSSGHIEHIMGLLPQTFVWMPSYGGLQEDYVPPVNRFANYDAASHEEADAAPAQQREEDE